MAFRALPPSLCVVFSSLVSVLQTLDALVSLDTDTQLHDSNSVRQLKFSGFPLAMQHHGTSSPGNSTGRQLILLVSHCSEIKIFCCLMSEVLCDIFSNTSPSFLVVSNGRVNLVLLFLSSLECNLFLRLLYAIG